MVVNPLTLLIPTLPSVGDIGDILSIIRAGELRDLGPGFRSVRDFARVVGVNESTLRSAYLTEGRRPSAQTQSRVDEAIRRNLEPLLGVRTTDRTVTWKAYGRNPLARLYLVPPPERRGVRMIVRTNDGTYDGWRTYKLDDPDIAIDEATSLLDDTESLDTVVWAL